MQFKKPLLAGAVGAALGAIAMPAAALDANLFNAANAVTIRLSGASAQDNAIRLAVATMCNAGTLDWYQNSSTNSVGFCAVTPGSFSPALPGSITQLVVVKSSTGSGGGVTPLQTGSSLAFMNLPASAAACTGGVSTVGSGAAEYTLRLGCPLATTTTRADYGFSDVEPKLLGGNFDGESANALIFGIAVSENLYRALQTMQGFGTQAVDTSVDGTVDTGVTGVAVTVQDNEAYMPSLSRETIAGLMAGQIDWSMLRAADGTTLAPAASNPANVYVARRAANSGSQKSTEIFLYGDVQENRCLRISPTPMVSSLVTSESLACDTATPSGTTLMGGNTGAVINCLGFHSARGRYAIGLLTPSEGTYPKTGMRFIKVDGYAPSLLNVSTGNYKFWVEQSVNSPQVYSPAANTPTVKTRLLAQLSDPTVLSQINTGIVQPWGFGALLGLPSAFEPTDPADTAWTQASIQANPVNPFTKSPTGTLQNCLPGLGVSFGVN